ncbi:histidine--tRNA ligase [Candidatus Berkelbacteria bacterium]|nr:histidine--tRNA ligase [Candidatus Berkelbacteria bacterium]
MASQIMVVRGMRDVLPDEQKYWTKIQEAAKRRFQSFGFQRIDTPVIESQALYLRGTGQTTDIVTKELFGVSRLGNRVEEGSEGDSEPSEQLVLRPEGTPGLVRAYIDHGMHTWPQPVKLFSFMPMFRYDRPQKGRYRQHTQLDVEVLGDEAPLTDAMTILVLWQLLQDLGLDTDAVIELNSLGDSASHDAINQGLRTYFQPHLTSLSALSQERFKTNPLRILDSKDSEDQPFLEKAPQIVDFLNETSRTHFMTVLEYLDEAGVPYDLNPFLVRGLDYYTHTVFEIRDRTDDRRQASLASGGRYDQLVEQLGGQATPAFGFGMGIERIVAKMIEKHLPADPEPGTEILIIQLGDRAKKKAIPLLVSLSKRGLAISMALGKESLKSQLRSADHMGAKLALIVGEREAIDGTIIVRNMHDSTQETIDFSDIERVVDTRLADLANA